MKIILPLLVGALVALALVRTSAGITLNHVDRGAFRSSGGAKLAGSYAVRALNTGAFSDPFEIGSPVERERNYHTFDLSGFSGSITGATLRIWVDAVDENLGSPYQSSELFETVQLFDVNASAAVLQDPSTDAAAALLVFDDLGSGDFYGSLVVQSDDASKYVSVALNAAAIEDLNAAIGNGSWSVGGALVFNGSYGANSNFISERVLHDDNIPENDQSAQLVLTGTVIPEPASAAIGVATMLLLLASAHSRQTARRRTRDFRLQPMLDASAASR